MLFDNRPLSLLDFVGTCDNLLAKAGVTAPAVVNGVTYEDARVFVSPGVNVAAHGKELEVCVRYLDGVGEVRQASVVSRGPNGDIYLARQEWAFAAKRVHRLLNGENPTEPISLVKDEDGWLTGRD